jgi:hypothetical protein
MTTKREWLQQLANSTTSTEQDDTIMQDLLHRINLPKARVVCGVAYLEGIGQPISIQTVAQMILERVNK